MPLNANSLSPLLSAPGSLQPASHLLESECSGRLAEVQSLGDWLISLRRLSSGFSSILQYVSEFTIWLLNLGLLLSIFISVKDIQE